MNRLVEAKRAIGTLLGRPRREHILRLLPRHAVGAEVGVFRGEYTRHILRIAQPRELHLIDGWWEIYGDRFPDWGPYTDWGRLRTRDAYDEARAVVEAHGAEAICTVHVGDDVAVLDQFGDRYFDWVYLDTDHEFEHTLEELEALNAKVRPTGLIVGDDWHEDPSHIHHGVCRAVRDFASRRGWKVTRLDDFGQWCIQRQPGSD
jgi:Methyltransferase domain